MSKQTIDIINGTIKPEDVFKIIDFKFKYIAMDEDGFWQAYSGKPYLSDDNFWRMNYGVCCGLQFILGIDYTGDWEDSLHERKVKLPNKQLNL